MTIPHDMIQTRSTVVGKQENIASPLMNRSFHEYLDARASLLGLYIP